MHLDLSAPAAGSHSRRRLKGTGTQEPSSARRASAPSAITCVGASASNTNRPGATLKTFTPAGFGAGGDVSVGGCCWVASSASAAELRLSAAQLATRQASAKRSSDEGSRRQSPFFTGPPLPDCHAPPLASPVEKRSLERSGQGFEQSTSIRSTERSVTAQGPSVAGVLHR
jgi:hypothetical protein